jgi:hypothetical protein
MRRNLGTNVGRMVRQNILKLNEIESNFDLIIFVILYNKDSLDRLVTLIRKSRLESFDKSLN